MNHVNQPVDEFKRLNFFNGFFTTADDWNDGEQYHIAKRQLHNRALHTPGILRGQGDELQVTALGGLKVRVKSGAALDGCGNIISVAHETDLDLGKDGPPAAAQTLYLYVQFGEEAADCYINAEDPEFSGYRRMWERPAVNVMLSAPDNVQRLELARVRLTAGASVVTDPDNPEQPGANEIDGTQRPLAGSIGALPPRLEAETQRDLNTRMADLRENMAALAVRFDAPSIDDVRGAALHVRLLAAQLEPQGLPNALRILADIQQDVGEELAVRCPPLVQKAEYQGYQSAVAALLASLAGRAGAATLLNDQGAINSAVRDLAEVVFPLPTADAGKDRTETTLDPSAAVKLDASLSQAAPGQRIVRYIWEEIEA